METLELAPEAAVIPIEMAPVIPDLPEITSMDDYLRYYGRLLGKKAIESLDPLHVPGRDDLPDFSDIDREPFPAQSHCIAATAKMLNEKGSGFIVGEPGTGKTIMGMTAVHKHAQQSRNKGGSGGNYRALILCPDHLIGKWEREILETIPGATVTRFGPRRSFDDVIEGNKRRVAKAKKGKTDTGSRQSLRDTLALSESGHAGAPKTIPGEPQSVAREYPVSTGEDAFEVVKSEPGEMSGSVLQLRSRWEKPVGPQWFVMGRNQAKWMSDWVGMADEVNDFDDASSKGAGEPGARKSKGSVSKKPVIVDRIHVVDEYNRTQYHPQTGRPLTKIITADVYYCPSCGKTLNSPKGTPFAQKDLSSEGKNATQKKCDGLFMVSKFDPEKPNHGRDRRPIPDRYGGAKPGSEIKHAGRTWEIRECGEPLYNYVSRPYRWSPARVVQKQLKRLFKYLIIDEVHEHKSDESGQSMACSKLMAGVDHILALTGTIIGGYADHLFPLLMRICGQSLRDEGFEWGKDLPFSEVYGRIDRIVTTSENVSTSVSGNSKSMRRAKTGKSSERKAVRPGIMPPLFGNHLIGNAVFITLQEMADELPDLFEYIGGECPEFVADPGWIPEQLEAEQDRYDRMKAGWVDCGVDLNEEQREEYNFIAAVLEQANKELLQKGSMKLLGAMLWTLLGYPDKPFGWDHDPELRKAIAEAAGQKVPGLLGQSFLKHFDYRFDKESQSLVLTRTNEDETTEECRVALRKDGGTYNLDVVINGKTVSLCYDTGASVISLSEAMADDVGFTQIGEGQASIADGSIVPTKEGTLATVRVGSFELTNVVCSVPIPKLPHTIGFWEKPGVRTEDNWVGVVTPKSLDESVVYPKEERLIEICKMQKEHGFQTWIGLQMTGKRNIMPRLRKILEAQGLKVGILRATDVEPREREEWIMRHGREFDVMISHPKLISTGLDLFSKAQGGHNYNAIVLYQTGYNPFDMRQFSRRAWRIGQPRDCRVYYLYYRATMQHRCMDLMAKKFAASQALEGEFSADGLAAMAGDENIAMGLAKSLSEQVADADLQRNWGRVQSVAKKKPRQDPLVEHGKKLPKSPLDRLPIEIQLAAEAILEGQESDWPDGAEEAYEEIAGRIDAVEPEGLSVFDEECQSDFDDDEDLMAAARRIYGGMDADLVVVDEYEPGNQPEPDDKEESVSEVDPEPEPEAKYPTLTEEGTIEFPDPAKIKSADIKIGFGETATIASDVHLFSPGSDIGTPDGADVGDNFETPPEQKPRKRRLRVVSDDDSPKLTEDALMKMFANMFDD